MGGAGGGLESILTLMDGWPLMGLPVFGRPADPPALSQPRLMFLKDRAKAHNGKDADRRHEAGKQPFCLQQPNAHFL